MQYVLFTLSFFLWYKRANGKAAHLMEAITVALRHLKVHRFSNGLSAFKVGIFERENRNSGGEVQASRKKAAGNGRERGWTAG